MRASLFCSSVLSVCLLIIPASSADAQSLSVRNPLPLWDVQIGASFVGTSGNSSTSSAGAELEAHRRGAVWQVESTATVVRASTSGETTAERYIGHVRGKRELSSFVGLTSGVKLERDPFSGVTFRSVIDAGLSWHLVRQDRWTVEGVTAGAWDHDRPTIGPDVNDPSGVVQLLSRVVFGTNSVTTQRFTLYPDFSSGGAVRFEAEGTAEATMNSHLALKLGHMLRYANAPVRGFKKYDNTSTASIVLRWSAVPPGTVH
jgi:putative salt-induced outer membrane protein YdiY